MNNTAQTIAGSVVGVAALAGMAIIVPELALGITLAHSAVMVGNSAYKLGRKVFAGKAKTMGA
jgi:hypothetical protein